MIDIVTDCTKELKDIRQIGTPSEVDKIYIEHLAYERLHQEDFAEKRVFVFMGHTQRKDRGYLTFIKSVIPVFDIEFEQNVPVWNNRIWSGIFREIKRLYEDDVIVGWAIDLKGIEPKISAEIEAVHREQFGGVHQILMIMDSLEQEEYFYQNRNNHLHKKDGFYIYYDSSAKMAGQNVDVQFEMPVEKTVFRRRKSYEGAMDNWQEPPQEMERERPKAQYRALLEEKSKGTDSGKRMGVYGIVAVLVLLIGIVGTGLYQKRIHINGLQKIIETFGSGAQAVADTENTETMQGTLGDMTEQTVEESSQSEAIETLNNMQNADNGIPTPENSELAEEYVQVEETSGGTIMQSPSANVTEEASNLEEIPDVAVTETMEEMAEQNQTTPQEVQQYYTVKKGDTLTSICYQIYGTIERLVELEIMNGLENPDDIREGQQLVLPQ